MHVWLRRFSWTLSLKSLLGPVYMNWVSLVSRTGARFSKVLITFRARKPVLCLSSLHLKSKWMIQCNYQLTKQNLPVCELGTMLLFNRFWFKNLPSDPQSYRAFRETGPGPLYRTGLAHAFFPHKIFVVFIWEGGLARPAETPVARAKIWASQASPAPHINTTKNWRDNKIWAKTARLTVLVHLM